MIDSKLLLDMQCIERTGRSFVGLVRVRHVILEGRYSATILAILPLPVSRHVKQLDSDYATTSSSGLPASNTSTTTRPISVDPPLAYQTEGSHGTLSLEDVSPGVALHEVAPRPEVGVVPSLRDCVDHVFPLDDDGVARTDIEHQYLGVPVSMSPIRPQNIDRG